MIGVKEGERGCCSEESAGKVQVRWGWGGVGEDCGNLA